jgi:hypothetical protein
MSLICANEKVEQVLKRIGWGLRDNEPYPLGIQIDDEKVNLPQYVQDGINKCLKRFRDGDLSGAMTSICSIVDSLTEEVYNRQGIGNHKDDPYQTRVSKAFNVFETAYKKELIDNGIDHDEVKRIWENQNQIRVITATNIKREQIKIERHSDVVLGKFW